MREPAALPSILIVDDVVDSREMYAAYLASKGHVVHTATDGRDGLMKVHLFRPDIVVLDLTMPGLDGIDVLRALRVDARTAEVFVIVLTAHALKDTREQVMAAGANMYLTKPCFPDDLAEAITTRRPPPRPQDR
jgi:CheY-like chemotaxis protein